MLFTTQVSIFKLVYLNGILTIIYLHQDENLDVNQRMHDEIIKSYN